MTMSNVSFYRNKINVGRIFTYLQVYNLNAANGIHAKAMVFHTLQIQEYKQ